MRESGEPIWPITQNNPRRVRPTAQTSPGARAVAVVVIVGTTTTGTGKAAYVRPWQSKPAHLPAGLPRLLRWQRAHVHLGSAMSRAVTIRSNGGNRSGTPHSAAIPLAGDPPLITACRDPSPVALVGLVFLLDYLSFRSELLFQSCLVKWLSFWCFWLSPQTPCYRQAANESLGHLGLER